VVCKLLWLAIVVIAIVMSSFEIVMLFLSSVANGRLAEFGGMLDYSHLQLLLSSSILMCYSVLDVMYVVPLLKVINGLS